MVADWLKTFPPKPAPDARGPRRIPKRKKKPGKRPTKNRNVGKLAGIVKMPLDVFHEVRRLGPPVRRLGGIILNHLSYTDCVLPASLGFTPHLSCIQAFPIYAYDEGRSQFLASGPQEHRYA